MTDEKIEAKETIEATKPKKKVGRPTREEAARKAASRPGRRPGSKNKSSKLKRDEAKAELLKHISSGIMTMARLCKEAKSETVQANCAKWLVEMGLEIYSEQESEKPKSEQPGQATAQDNSNIKIFPFSRVHNQQ